MLYTVIHYDNGNSWYQAYSKDEQGRTSQGLRVTLNHNCTFRQVTFSYGLTDTREQLITESEFLEAYSKAIESFEQFIPKPF